MDIRLSAVRRSMFILVSAALLSSLAFAVGSAGARVGSQATPAQNNPGGPGSTPPPPAPQAPAASGVPFELGDIFVATINSGIVKHYSPTGTLKATLQTGTAQYEDGMCFDEFGNLHTTNWSSSSMTKFDPSGNVLANPWVTTPGGRPESCAIADSGEVYVGLVDGSSLRRYSPQGTLLAQYAPVAEDRGVDWIDLAADQCTIVYTSEGARVLRFNVCTNAQLSDLASGLPEPCFDVAIRDNGEVMVACTPQVVRLSSTGAILQTYSAASLGVRPFGLALDIDGTSFWTVDFQGRPCCQSTGKIVKVDIATGAVVSTFTEPLAATTVDVYPFEATAPPAEQAIGNCGVGVHAYSRSACRQGVNTLTGAYTTHVADLELPGIGVPLLWRRSYSSSDSIIGGLGCGWTSSYEVRLTDAAPLPLWRGSARLEALGTGDLLLRGEDGQQVLYARKADGSYVGAPGALSRLSQVGSEYELVRHDQVKYRFDADGRLTSIKDRNDQGLTFAYNATELETITDSVGRQISVQYAGGRLSRVTLPDGRYVEYGYTDGRLNSVRDAGGGMTEYTYEGVCRLKTTVDQNQNTQVRLDYDQTSERVTDQYNALNDHSVFAWDAQTQTATLTDARQNEWEDRYSSNVLLERVNPLEQSVSFSYDRLLNVTKVTDARGNATTMIYDARGNLLKRVAPAPLSYIEEWTYNARNDPETHKDGRTFVTDYEYDGDGNLIWVEGPDADGPGPLGRPKTLYGRDPAGTGLLASITDPRGKQTTLSYTDGNLTDVRTQLGNRTTLCYDGSGRLIGLVDPRGTQSCALPNDYRWSYTYTDTNQLESQSDPLGNTTALDYDPAGNLRFRTDAKSHVTEYGYDDANRLEMVTDPDPDGTGPLDAPVTTYDYDAVGSLEFRTDDNGHQTHYEYNTANRLFRVTAPDSRVWSYAFDQNGNLTEVVDANGSATPTTGDGQTTYGYDELNRLKTISHSDATPAVSFQYDENGNRRQMTDGAGTETYLYDPLNRLTTVTRGSDVFSYGYDLVNLTRATYPGQSAITYIYDDDERLQSVVSGLGASYAYYANGSLQSTFLGNNYVETRSYDRAGRLTDVTSARSGTTLSAFAITPDQVGNPEQVVRTGSLAQTQRYTYDNLDRLSEVCFQAAACTSNTSPFIRWTYDGVGNRTTEQRPGNPPTTTSYVYNDADELTTAGSTSYTYDKNGNEFSAGSRTFTYDLANRVKTTTLGNTTTTYLYDGDGKRLQASTGIQANKKTNFLWDVNLQLSQLALERDGSNALIRRYMYGQRRVTQTAGSSTSFYIYDGLGSAANLTSSSGATQWTWSYEPFGQIRTQTKANGPQPDNLHKFAGEYADPTGLYHLRARQYDPQTGRFLSRDPVSGAGSAYVYAGDSPTAFVDPAGEQRIRLCALGFGWGGCANRPAKPAHAALDVVGLVPVVGEPADAVNCLWYGAEGDYVNAGLSCGAIVPVLGIAATGAKFGSRAAKLTDRAAVEESAVVSVVHGNTRLSPKTTYLYRLSDENGNYLKTGITSNPGGRYSQKFLLDKRLDFLTSGSRSDMLNLERFIVGRDPGPWNYERWAGEFSGDVP